MVPATLLGVGLADVDIKDHIKNSFLWVWAFSIICMFIGVIVGIIPVSYTHLDVYKRQVL